MTTTSPASGTLRERPPADPGRSGAGALAAELERDQAVARIRTEMSAPLQALQTLRAALADGGLSSELDQRMVQHTKTLARRLSLLLEDLVLVSTQGQERLVLDVQELLLSAQLARASSLFPDLSIRVEGDLDVSVRADPLRLQQLLANLVCSARPVPARPVRLQVTPVDETVLLELRDAPSASGYELDLVRQLVHAHGGRVDHRRDQGAVVVTLPAAGHPRT